MTMEEYNNLKAMFKGVCRGNYKLEDVTLHVEGCTDINIANDPVARQVFEWALRQKLEIDTKIDYHWYKMFDKCPELLPMSEVQLGAKANAEKRLAVNATIQGNMAEVELIDVVKTTTASCGSARDGLSSMSYSVTVQPDGKTLVEPLSGVRSAYPSVYGVVSCEDGSTIVTKVVDGAQMCKGSIDIPEDNGSEG